MRQASSYLLYRSVNVIAGLSSMLQASTSHLKRGYKPQPISAQLFGNAPMVELRFEILGPNWPPETGSFKFCTFTTHLHTTIRWFCTLTTNLHIEIPSNSPGSQPKLTPQLCFVLNKYTSPCKYNVISPCVFKRSYTYHYMLKSMRQMSSYLLYRLHKR